MTLPHKISPKKILVVDDDPQVAKTIEMILKMSGHTVELIPSAEEALTKFEIGKYDLVLTDYKMTGMNGLAFASAIKARAKDQAIIMISAYGYSVPPGEGTLDSVDGIVLKPFSLNDLLEALAKVFPPA